MRRSLIGTFRIHYFSNVVKNNTNNFLCIDFCPNRSIRSFSATLGASGGKRGYSGITGHVSNGLAWYINGLMIPELWLRRGLTYSFKVIFTQLFHAIYVIKIIV